MQAALTKIKFNPLPVYRVEPDFLRSLGLPLPALPKGKRKARSVFRFPDAVCRAMRAPARTRVSAWAEKKFVVVEGSRPGPWRNSNSPFLAGVMDAWGEPFVEEVVFCAAPQVGKSKVGEIVTAYVVDQDPAPTQYIIPNEDAAAELVDERLRPLFEQSPRLAGYLTGKVDDISKRGVRLKHMSIFLAWAGSAAKLAAKAIKNQVYEEVDKYPEQATKKEASPEALGEKRQRTFRFGRKRLKVSSPTIESGPIWQALQACNARFHFHARCPACGWRQRLHFTAPDGRTCVCWPEKERNPQRIEDGHLAWYECERCGDRWGDWKRDQAVARGEWREETTGLELFAYLRQHRPRRVGFHLSALYSPFVSLSETAGAFLKANQKQGSAKKIALRDFLNGYLAEPWVDYQVERSEDRILALCDDRPRGLVPGGGVVAALLAGVDTQDNDFYYVIRAFGWGESEESWLVQCGVVPSFEALAQVLWGNTYRDPGGREYYVRLAIQDAMGHRTRAVYDFCRKRRGRIHPFKGEQRLAQPTTFSNIEHYPGTNIVIPGGLKLLRADVNFFKNDLARKLEINPADPGASHLHMDTPEAYASQMTAEYLDEATQLWACPEHKANHYWDCEVYALVGAHLLGVRQWIRQDAKQPTASGPPGPQSSPSGPGGSEGAFGGQGRPF